MNKKLLKSKMSLHGDTQNTLAEALGISFERLSLKMNAKKLSDTARPAAFTLAEVRIIMERYSLTPEEVVEIFLLQPSTD